MWIFENGVLLSPDGQHWRAVSGPYGKGKLPNGKYSIGQMLDVNPSSYSKGAYRDANGITWFCRLEPRFETARSGLGIHPDGNTPGTLGCVGIKAANTRPLYNKLKASRGAELMVK